jgi:hypothetical protein
MKVLCSNDELMRNWTTRGFIREDQNHNVFHREANAKQECLWYNFYCKPGEILHLEGACTGDYLVDSIATKIDQLLPRKHFYLKDLAEYSLKEEWIEGIGSTWGVLNGGGAGHCLTGGVENLLCSYEKEIKTYQSTQFPNDCYLSPEIIDGINSKAINSNFKVYPNPVSGALFVQPRKSVDEGFTIEIFSMKGELVKTECVDGSTNIYQIDVSSLKTGIYILRMVSVSGNYSEEIIIKN